MSNSVEVTGVQSGAARARSLAVAVERLTEQYQADLARVGGAIVDLASSAAGNIELNVNSRVITALINAAEVLAGARAAAGSASAEVAPALRNAARAFDAISN